MIGTTTFSTIREKLREAYAKEGVNPIISLDRRIRNLKKSKSADAGELESLESFRRALAQIVDGKPAKPVRSSKARPTKKAM